MNFKRFTRICTAAFSSAIVLSGCSEPTPPKSDAPYLAELFADDSDSTPAVLADRQNQIFEGQRDIPDGVLIRIYRYGRDVERIYEGPAIRSFDKFQESVSSKFRQDNTETETHTELPVELAARNASGKEIYTLYIASDGGMEVMSHEVMKRLAKGMKSLASNSAVRQVAIVGVLPKHQLRWMKWTSQLEEGRYVRGNADAESIPNPWESVK